MAYITEGQLSAWAISRPLRKSASTQIVESTKVAQISIFLSHSHLDKTFADGMIQQLGNQGIQVYVDWNDTSMPRVTDRATADNIKEKIEELSLFVALATKNALKSRWVPWEIGIADQAKGVRKVLIVPVVDFVGIFVGNEYLKLYPHLKIEENRLMVYDPERKSKTDLETYLDMHNLMF